MKSTFLMVLVVGISVGMPTVVLAHRSGCHNLHTCPSDSKSYVCGDLGYPCSGATSIKDIPLSAINVPLVVEKAFAETFERNISNTESVFWKKRFRNDKDGLYKIRKTMQWHKANGSSGPPASITNAENLVTNMNTFFQAVYGRMPTESENKYWLTRINDKPSEQALKNTMAYHKTNNLQH